MAATAFDDDDDTPSPRQRMLVALALVAAAVLIGLLVWWLAGVLSAPTGPKRQVTTIALLPDTPPPPPPPPKPDKPPEPKDQPKPQPVEQAQRPPDAPKQADAPLKMEGPAGSGDSPFQAGSVASDYKGGVPASGPGGAGTAADRAQERYYASTARQLLQGEIERRYAGDAQDLVATFRLWIAGDGAIERYELVPTGDTRNDGDLRAALDLTARSLRLPPPPVLLQPLRFRLSVRGAG